MVGRGNSPGFHRKDKMSAEPKEKPHLSDSALNMLSRCGEQYRRRYVEGDREAPGVSLIVGIGVDASVSANLRAKKHTKKLLTIEEVSDAARDSVVGEFGNREVRLIDDEVSDGLKATKAKAVDKAVRLSRLHAYTLAPNIEPTEVQRWWQIDIPGYPMNLTGKIDVQEGSDSIRDTKTSAKTPNAAAADESNQLTLYALAVKVVDGQAPAKVFLDTLVDLKTGAKPVVLESRRTDADFRVMLARVERAMEVVEKGAFVPANQTDWWCSDRFCGYAPTCPFFRRPVTISMAGAVKEK